MSGEQDSFWGPPFPSPLGTEGLTCSEFSGYSCRTARAPRTCKRQKPHSPTKTPWAQGPTLLRSPLTRHLKPDSLHDTVPRAWDTGWEESEPRKCGAHVLGRKAANVQCRFSAKKRVPPQRTVSAKRLLGLLLAQGRPL